MDKSEWQELVEQHFDFLFIDRGFEITSNEYFEHLMGGRITTLENDKYLIIIELDRSRLSVNITSKKHSGFGGYMVAILGYLHGKTSSHYNRYNLDKVGQLEHFGQLFKENEVDIFNFFEQGDWKETKQKFDDYIKKGVSEMTWKDFE